MPFKQVNPLFENSPIANKIDQMTSTRNICIQHISYMEIGFSTFDMSFMAGSRLAIADPL